MRHNIKTFYSGDSETFLIEDDKIKSTSICQLIFIKGNDKQIFEATLTEDKKSTFNLSSDDTMKIKKGLTAVFFILKNNNDRDTFKLIDVEIKADIFESSSVEVLSYERQMLVVIDDVLANRIKSGYESYSISGRSIVGMSPEKLLQLKAHFQEQVKIKEGYVMENGVRVNRNNRLKVKMVSRFYK